MSNLNKRNPIAKAVKFALLAGATMTALSSPLVFAADEEDENTVTITGSRIKRSDIELASPVVTISAEDITSGGYTSVQDVLDNLTQNSNGSLTQQSIHGFTPAASGVNLRGAGLGRVLTLIDGKRIAKYPLAAGGTTNFADTANIPIGAVERVELLTSGASAIYGSDAMGGVINIILKSDYEGTTVEAKVGKTKDGGRGTSKVNLVTGSSTANSNITFFIEYEERDQLKATDRASMGIGTDLAFDSVFSSYSSYGTSLRLGNSDVVATSSEEECLSRGLQPWAYSRTNTYGVCGFDRTTMRDLLPEQSRLSTMVKFNYELSNDMNLYGRADFTQGFVTTKIEPMPLNDYDFDLLNSEITVTADNDDTLIAVLPQIGSFNGDFENLDDGGYRYVHRAYEYGHRMNENETQNFTFLTGLEGSLTDDIEYDVSWQLSRTNVINWGSGYASVGGFFDMITAGTGHSLLLEISPAQVAASEYSTYNHAISNLVAFNAGITGTLFDLDAGAIEYAVGYENTREWFSDISDSETMAGRILSTGGASGEGGRSADSVYGELMIPVVDNLILNLAGRYDDYSDVGSQFTPQASLEYRPTDELLIRALYAETFRAPDMQRIYGDVTTGFNQITDPLGCTNAGGTLDPNSPYAACNGELYITSLTGPNVELDPETGDNFNIGAVYSTDDFDISLDYWVLNIENIVNNLGAQTIANNPDIYGSLITRDNDGFITLVNATAQNLSFYESHGVDFSSTYRLETDIGSLKFDLDIAYNIKDEGQFSEITEVTDNIAVTNIPDYRANFRTTWEQDNLTSSIFVNHISKMNGTNKSAFVPADVEFYGRQYIPSYTTVNWTFGYEYGNGSLITLGVNNIFDQGVIEDKTNWGWPHYPREYMSPVGREFTLTVSHTF